MELKKAAVAGSLESSDCQISLFPNPGGGIKIELKSAVKRMFGDAIVASVQEELHDFGVTDATVQINDKGAFDWVIRARMQCVICRAAEHKFDWAGVR